MATPSFCHPRLVKTAVWRRQLRHRFFHRHYCQKRFVVDRCGSDSVDFGCGGAITGLAGVCCGGGATADQIPTGAFGLTGAGAALIGTALTGAGDTGSATGGSCCWGT